MKNYFFEYKFFLFLFEKDTDWTNYAIEVYKYWQSNVFPEVRKSKSRFIIWVCLRISEIITGYCFFKK